MVSLFDRLLPGRSLMSVRSSVIRGFALESLASEEVRYRSLSFFFLSLFSFLLPCCPHVRPALLSWPLFPSGFLWFWSSLYTAARSFFLKYFSPHVTPLFTNLQRLSFFSLTRDSSSWTLPYPYNAHSCPCIFAFAAFPSCLQLRHLLPSSSPAQSLHIFLLGPLQANIACLCDCDPEFYNMVSSWEVLWVESF